MKEPKRPSIPIPTRAAPKSRSVAPPADLAKRVSACEAEIRQLRAELAALRAEVAAQHRKIPPPLPDDDEFIAVDSSEVVLESIRPPGARRKSMTPRSKA